MWDELEVAWGRGPIAKPNIVPKNSREFISYAINLLMETPFANTMQNLQLINNLVIDQQVKAHLSSAKEEFLHQKALHRDHPLHVRQSHVREKPKGVFCPISTATYSLNDPKSRYTADFAKLYQSF